MGMITDTNGGGACKVIGGNSDLERRAFSRVSRFRLYYIASIHKDGTIRVREIMALLFIRTSNRIETNVIRRRNAYQDASLVSQPHGARLLSRSPFPLTSKVKR